MDGFTVVLAFALFVAIIAGCADERNHHRQDGPDRGKE